MGKVALEFVEIDVPYCANDYGVSPCTASIGVTGTAKCFNGLGTCQDRANFLEETVTLRFAKPTAALPPDLDAMPSLAGVDYAPGAIALGVSLGERSTLTATFLDSQRTDTEPAGDKYVTERNYDPWKQGTYWGALRVRHPYLRGRAMRYISGQVGQTIDEMTTRHFIIDGMTGPTRGPGSTFTITAKDALKLADDDKAQAPALSTGYLSADINSAVTSATLLPTGIGAIEYAASGLLNIGGTEIVSFTRAGDVVTITRAQENTTAVEHKANDRVQQCLKFTAASPGTVLDALLVDHAGLDPSYTDLGAWQSEIDAYLDQVYTAVIAEPTGVRTLCNEIIEQAGLVVWPDDTGPAIRLQVLRPVAANATEYTAANTLEGTLQVQDQPDKRLSRVQVYFALRNPLLRLDDPASFLSVQEELDGQAETDNGAAGIKTIFSRWIPRGGRAVATRLAQLQLGRYVVPPRRITLAVQAPDFSDGPVALPLALGGAHQIGGQPIQDAFGLPATIPAQVTRLKPGPDIWQAEAEEVSFVEYDATAALTHTLILDGTGYLSVNLKTMHDAVYGALTADDVANGVTVIAVVQPGAIVGSNNPATPALDIGTGWPVGADITVQAVGRIQGAGGAGGPANLTPSLISLGAGLAGGVALYSRVPFSLVDASGEIWGGAGGGAPGGRSSGPRGAATGGGGQGYLPGAAGAASGTAAPGTAGTTEAPGTGGTPSVNFDVGDGGAEGADGGAGTFNIGGSGTTNGGNAGAAIDGVSFATTIGSPGDRQGAQVN